MRSYEPLLANCFRRRCVLQQRIGGTFTDDNTTSFTVDGLRPFATYSFKVSAVNAAGRSAASEASYNAMTLRAGELVLVAASKWNSQLAS